MSASPKSLISNLPTVLLDSDKDHIRFHRDNEEQLYYTIPKQVAACLWLDDGYSTNWLRIGNMYLSELIPQNQHQIEMRLDPTTIPE